jgi:AcrR family transcriptional regulator
MREIADTAGVSVKTLEVAFRTKATVLKVLVDVAIAGDEEPVAMVERPVIQQLRDERDAGRFLDLYAALVTDVSSRLAPISFVVEQAAGTDDDIADLWATMQENRLFGARYVAGQLADKTGWRRPRSAIEVDRVADVLFLFNDPAVYRTLVTARGWSTDEFRAWLAATYRRLLTP